MFQILKLIHQKFISYDYLLKKPNMMLNILASYIQNIFDKPMKILRELNTI